MMRPPGRVRPPGKHAVVVGRRVNPATRLLEDVTAPDAHVQSGGGGLYHSRKSGRFYNSYVAYTREADNRFLGAVKIVDAGDVDGTSSTDGIEVTNVPLGPAFPHGLFVAQDGYNVEKGVRVNQNFKLVPFERIANALGLTIDRSWDPRTPAR